MKKIEMKYYKNTTTDRKIFRKNIDPMLKYETDQKYWKKNSP